MSTVGGYVHSEILLIINFAVFLCGQDTQECWLLGLQHVVNS